MNLKFQ